MISDVHILEVMAEKEDKGSKNPWPVISMFTGKTIPLQRIVGYDSGMFVGFKLVKQWHMLVDYLIL